MKTIKLYLVIAILLVANTVLGQSYNYTPALQSWNPCTTTTLTERVFNSKGNLVGSSTTYKAGNVTSRIYTHDEKSGAIIFSVKKCSGNFNNAGAMIVIDGSTGDYWTATYKANASTAAVGFTNFSLRNGTNNFYVLITGSTANNIDEYFFAGKVSIFKTAPSLSISSSSNSVSAESGTGVISVNGSGNVNWTASSNASWLRVNTFSGLNNGNVDYEFDANLTTSTRTAKITVSGSGITKTFSLKQTGMTENLIISPDGQIEVSNSQGQGSISIESNLSWIASSSEDWLTVNQEKGENNSSIDYFFSENSNTETRTGYITLSGGNLTRVLMINQIGYVVTSINNTKNENVRIYNSTNGNCVIETLSPTFIRVLTISGKLVFEDKITKNRNTFNLYLPKGMYLLQSKFQTEKLIIW